MSEHNKLWQERKRWTFFALPFTFTKYELTEEKFILKKGFFTLTTDEIRLYRILDVSLKRSLMQRIFKLGTIEVTSKDKTLGNFTIINVPNSEEVYELLSDAVEKERVAKRVSSREFMDDDDDADDVD